MPKGKRKTRKAKQAEVEDYRHDDQRPNNPPVGMVEYEVVKEEPKQEYAYDPHLDPELRFDSSSVRARAERLLDEAEEALAAKDEATARARLAELRKMQEPWLQWAGKAEHTTFEVDPVSLYIHERISTQAILRAVRREDQPDQVDMRRLFGDPDLPLQQAVEFYQHEMDWANRLILGDSLLVMNSLLQREVMGGKVQMIYVDPPYGVKFASNFQTFVDRRDLKEGSDEDLTREPEMIKAYRDTWRLDLHSYLTYLRDRFLLCRELLHESGSIFVQISDDNLHHVRELLDEVFGKDNYVGQVAFRKTGAQSTRLLPSTYDFLLHYAKDRTAIKFRSLWTDKKPGDEGAKQYVWAESPDGREMRRLTADELANPSRIPEGWRIFRPGPLTSPGASGPSSRPLEIGGQSYSPGANRHWSIGVDDTRKLFAVGRAFMIGNTPCSKLYLDDLPVSPLKNVWADTGGSGFAEKPLYVVQTDTLAVARCILMSTDPGDLVLDPTCGGGTTAYVAEQWGRRWITCDTSRVALFLARQRLMTAKYEYYKLEDEEQGVGAGFNYKTVPHITLKSIAQNPELDPEKVEARRKRMCKGNPKASPDEVERLLHQENEAIIQQYAGQEILYDQPGVDRSKVRVSGPLTVEAIPPPSMDAVESPIGGGPEAVAEQEAEGETAIELAEGRHVETLIDLLRKDGVLFPNNRRMKFEALTSFTGGVIHAEATPEGNEKNGLKRVGISFGPLYGPVTTRQVEEGLREANVGGFDGIIFCGFAFDGAAQAAISANPHPKVKAFMAHMRPDMLMGDLLKTTASSQLFTVFGEPDVEVRRVDSAGSPQAGEELVVELHGVDVYDPLTGTVEATGADKVAGWFLDTDYDGRCFCIVQAFFPDKTAWEKLARALKGAVDEEKFEQFTGTTSLPFKPGEHRRIAVKVIDRRGNEVMVTRGLGQ